VNGRIRGRTHVRTRPRAASNLKISLASRGASTHVAKQNSKLYGAIEKAFEEESLDEIISFPRLSGGRPYLVLIPGQRFSVEERPEAVVVLVIDREQRAKVSGDTLVRLYNLTPSETRVALMLIDGKRLDQIAEELEVAQTTVVFHLKNLFCVYRTGLVRSSVKEMRPCQLLIRTIDFPPRSRSKGTRFVAKRTLLRPLLSVTA
jgi:hypothetical protein